MLGGAEKEVCFVHLFPESVSGFSVLEDRFAEKSKKMKQLRLEHERQN